jgi:hypothetical protein
MNSLIKTYLVRLMLLTVLLAGTGSLLFLTVAKVHYFVLFPFVLIFFFLFSFSTHLYQLKYSGRNLAGFARSHMVVTLLRLVVYSAVVVLYFILSGEKAISFVVVIAVLYTSFTIFETRSLTRIIKAVDKQSH